MGFAAAHVLKLAADGSSPLSFGATDLDSLTSVHDIDVSLLRSRIAANLGPAGPTPAGPTPAGQTQAAQTHGGR
jgi:hypothetical protein